MSALALQSFGFEGNTVRVTQQEGAPWFVAQDVCAVLGIGKHRDAISRLDEDERGSVEVDTLGGRQEVAAVNESGFYTLALRCRAAMTPGTMPYRFRKWVTGELLPCLRATGTYALAANDPGNIPGPLGNLMTHDGRDRAKVLLVAIREARCIFGNGAAGALWIKLGFPPPEYVALPQGWEPKANYMIAIDSGIALWKDERLLAEDPEAEPVEASRLFADYRDWCERRHREPLSHSIFGKNLTALGVASAWNKGAARVGVKLAD